MKTNFTPPSFTHANFISPLKYGLRIRPSLHHSFTVAHDGNSETMADTNDEHTRINEDEPQFDEDPPWIEEMKMREFERRNEVSMSE